MAKTKQKKKLDKRDWLIVALLIGLIYTFVYAYQTEQARQWSEKSAGDSWLRHQVQINNLKACVDDDIRPCDIYDMHDQ